MRTIKSREHLVYHVQELERLQALKDDAAADLKNGFAAAQAAGYDPKTLKVVLKLRTLSPFERRQRRALEAIYLATLGMLDEEPLPDEARRRLDDPRDERREAPPSEEQRSIPGTGPPVQRPAQPPLALKDPAEAKEEGAEAAAAGKRIYDNPYPAGDPCRAAWDEGWCTQRNSHGMETPEAYQRRTAKPPAEEPKPDEPKEQDTRDGQQAKKGAA